MPTRSSNSAPHPFLSAADVARAMRLSVAEGVSWALMIGLAETYFVAYAVRLGASPLELGLVVTLPLCLGAAGPLAALAVLRRWHRRRWLVAAAAFFQALMLATIILLDGTGTMTAPLLVGCVCLYNMAGQSAGTAWASWFGDLVPRTRRGRYFARRNRAVQLATSIALVLGGLLLEALEPGTVRGLADSVTGTTAGAGLGEGAVGFRVIFTIAAFCRLGSAMFLILTPEPSFRGIAGRRAARGFLRSAPGHRAVRVVLMGAAFLFVVYLGSPYFGPFMLEELRFSYLEYMVASVFVVVVKAIVFPLWGRLLDRRGPRPVFLTAMVIVSIVPLPWLAARGLSWVLLGQLISGTGWAAYEVSYFALLLESTTRAVRPHVFAAQSILNGSMQLLGGVLAGLLLDRGGASFRTLFVVTMAGRLLVAGIALYLVTRAVTPAMAGRFSMRLVGARWTGGLGYRPIEAVSDALPEEAPRHGTGDEA